MSSTRLYIEQPIVAGSEAEISGDPANYVGRVLRLKAGDALTLFDGRGAEYEAVLRSLSKSSIRVTVGDKCLRSTESPLRIHLLQGVSRGERMDLVVQKATELGVHRITPVLTDHTMVRLDDKRAAKRTQHWKGIAASACEQCGRNVLPVVDSPIALRTWISEHPGDQAPRLIMTPGAAVSLASVRPVEDRLTLLIGPEGGFSDAEYELAELTGFKSVGFGPRVLRTETAALAILAALQVLFGDLAPA
jgi:16S rRNA (uracil1498-N3)-methyltransferase